MSDQNFIIDNFYWKRVQLYIEGHFKNSEETSNCFFLRNLTESIEVKANDVQFKDNKFIARFNIAILNEGDYLPSGEYILIYKKGFDYIAQLNNKLLKISNYKLNDNQQDEYNSFKTLNDKNNYLLDYYAKTFKKNGNSEKYKYTVSPKISKEVNEFVINVKFNKPSKKISKLRNKINKVKNNHKKNMYNIRAFLFILIFKTTKLFRVKKGNMVLFTSDSRGDLSGNFKFIYDEMINRRLDSKYDINIMLKPNISARRNFIDKFKFPYLLAKSDYIFVDDFHPLLYKVSFRKNQEIIQLWHAVGAFKTVGFSRVGKIGGPMLDSRNHRNYTKAYVSSASDIPFYAEAYGIKEENVYPLGVPRTDIFFNENYEKSIIEQIELKLPIIKGKKVILFAPTFRGNGHRSAHYPFFKIDFARLAKYCFENNAIVLFKMHPFVENKIKIPKKYENYFKDISNYREVNDILFITDILISDYSSLIYEFAVFKRPMLFYAFDLEDYVSSRDFYEPYEEFVPGKIVKTFNELMNSLYNNSFHQEKVPEFLDKHFNYQDGKSSERIVRHIFGR
ncbi:CDP-glycerol glycerophosphotransferase family protein [Staphylococcus pseudintermedius]|uniref:CDP-glycerol glycerophosphotransferase family protein n=1 Tax=Staphylococcus pseudintermedius TaxID=283734 RepID=UPI001441401D|nr:CDP-glycerol glycerophosphotransferase family protein [Staphylococcus pseudintermedius]EGQ3357512.1 CDP-glycerol glycerophosphotransferase family protein [Staphylococcus pseudintermedius]EGQ3365097.1 CDP-glycerol glycerophosphotransferase family protein [Staphylococcus pseudintermedius]EGQ3434059.1 CDP-glycerol glycerophosphotransferase family protein [Staphylococcus pseudintermedius]EGQ3640420.1 CDP-glycerol glycerophosphotransferase family protein [Staphylococcus pseudintermedius]EGQ38436